MSTDYEKKYELINFAARSTWDVSSFTHTNTTIQ